MTTVYLVKSFGYEGYTNLKVFADEDKANAYAGSLGVPLANSDDDLGDEFVEVEPFTLEGSL